MKIIHLPSANKIRLTKLIVKAQLAYEQSVVKAGNLQFIRNNPFFASVQMGSIA